MRLHKILLASSIITNFGFAFTPPGFEDDDRARQASRNEFAADQSTLNKLLHEAAAAGQIEAVKDLIKRGAPLDGRDDNTWTPLMKATRGNHFVVVQALLDAGADMNVEIEHCKSCKESYGYYDEDYPPSWRGPRERRAAPPHDCKKYLTAPLLAQREGRHEIAALFKEYKSRCEEIR